MAIRKIQIDPDQNAFNARVVKRLNDFAEVACTFVSADIATTFSHGLGKLPSHAISRIQNKSGSIYATSSDVGSWTRSQVVLRCSNSNVISTVKVE